MKIRFFLALCGVGALAACDPTMNTSGELPELPEAVVEMAAPGQDLGSARLRPEDGCYWYLHRGPVETTLLPLRTPGGNPICTRAAS